MFTFFFFFFLSVSVVVRNGIITPLAISKLPLRACPTIPHTYLTTHCENILMIFLPQVLFFEDRPTISSFQEKFAAYADKFPTWAAHSDGFTQIAIWTALEAEGLGANLQHYNPLIDQKVAASWGVSKDWELVAQLVFGKKEGEAGEKTYLPIEERFKSFGS